MAEINTVIAEASQDLQTIEDFVNLPADSEVYPRLLPSVNVGTLAGTRQAIFEAGGLPATPFATKALMTASALVDGDYAMVTDDADNNGLYVKTEGVWSKSAYDPIGVANGYADAITANKQNVFETKSLLEASSLPYGSYALVINDTTDSNNGFYHNSYGTWVKSAYKPLEQAKTYANNLLSTKLTTTTNLNDLLTGTYYITSPDMNTIYDNGTYIALGYPANMIRGGGAVVEVTRSAGNGTQSFQKLTYTSQGKFFTRSGVAGGDFTTWAKTNGGGSGSYESEALGLINAEDGDTFWVYPTSVNGILALTLYKRLNATTSEVVFTQKNPLDEFLITQDTKWELV